MTTRTLKVSNISCQHCVATISRELGEIPGVEKVEGDPQTKMVTVTWHDPASWEEIRAALEEIGYPPEP